MKRRLSQHEDATERSKRVRADSSTVAVDAGGLAPSLCASCASISPARLFSVQQGSSSRRIMKLGTLDSPESRSCQVCQLFSSVSHRPPGSAAKPQWLYAHPARSSDVWGRKGQLLVVASEDSEDDLDYHLDTHGAISFTGSAQTAHFVRAQRVRHDGVNFELCKDWINTCSQHHDKCRRYATAAPTPKGMKLIDCDTRQIVPAQSHKYVALSYVWGLAALGPGYDDRVVNGTLPGLLPKTIEDAILATLKLGFQYLWIDRYCINQESAEEKESQIIQMNFIYRKAQVTLIASAGEDPRYGLPGVSTTPRTPQPAASIQNVELVSILPRPEIAVQRSKWAERGWTYQEGYFSIRRLDFTEDQVFFECYNGAAVEAVSHIRSDGVPYAVEDVDEGDQDAFEILEHLTEYSGKQLTYDSDALNAVVGVFNDYGYKHGVTPHYLGVPIVRYSLFDLFRPGGQRRRVTEGFLVGLSWMNREPGRRRNIWPSWTWAEWAVSFDYGPPSSTGRSQDSFALGTDFVVKPRVCIERKTGTPLDLEVRSTLDALARSPNDLSRFIQVESWTFALVIKSASVDKNAGQASVQEKGNRYRAFLRGENIDIKADFWPMLIDWEASQERRSATAVVSGVGSANGEIVGVMLSKASLENGQYAHIIMVVQDRGTHFERIGHCSIMSNELLDLAKRCGRVEEGWNFGWRKYHATTARLCARYMTRRTLRIG